MNLLQVEIFNGKATYVVTNRQKVNIYILSKDIEQCIKKMTKISTCEKVLFQIFCFVVDNSIYIEQNSPVQVMIFRYDKNIAYNCVASTIENIEIEIEDYLQKDEGCAILDCNMDINRYKYLIFSRKALQKIITATQQYLSFNELQLKDSLTLNVATSCGIESLFANGNSRNIQNRILDIDSWENLRICKTNVINPLYVEDMNNFISSICIDTGDYALSLKVIDENLKKCTILHLRRTMRNFWSNIEEHVYCGKKCIMLKREDNWRNT